MDTKQILEKKQIGDVVTVANMLKVNYSNADKILRRPNSKRHEQAMMALKQIVETRESLIAKCNELIDSL